jgi:hypothetical protein
LDFALNKDYFKSQMRKSVKQWWNVLSTLAKLTKDEDGVEWAGWEKICRKDVDAWLLEISARGWLKLDWYENIIYGQFERLRLRFAEEQWLAQEQERLAEERRLAAEQERLAEEQERLRVAEQRLAVEQERLRLAGNL